MTLIVELEQILNFALGTPEVGAVNFNILHGLIYEILKHLGISKKKTEISGNGAFRTAYAVLSGDSAKEAKEDAQTPIDNTDAVKGTPPPDSEFTTSRPFSGLLESKVSQIENRLKILDELPSTEEIIRRAKQQQNGKTPVAELWQNINTNRRLGATEQGLEKVSQLLDSMMSEVNEAKGLAGDIEKLNKKITELEKENINLNKENQNLNKENQNLNNRLAAIEAIDNSEDKKNIQNLLKDLEKLRGTVAELPTKDDLDKSDIYVKWPELDETLKNLKSPSPKPKTPPPKTPSPKPRYPSAEALEALKQVGEVIERHEKLEEKVIVLEDEMPNKANVADLEELRKRPDVPDDVAQQLESLKSGLQNLNQLMDKDGDALEALRKIQMELQSEQEKLNTASQEMIEEHNRKQKHIEALYKFLERLQESKADKDFVSMEIDAKADKQALDNLISRAKFDQSVGTLDQTLQDVLQRLDGYETTLQETLEKLNVDLDLKLDRLELTAMKEYLEKRIKANKCKHQGDQQLQNDAAAGFRKALLRFQCISCDRPVEMPPGPIPPIPSLPVPQGLLPSRTGRPYTTFDLDQLRQMNRGMYTYDPDGVVASLRSCGGSHTVTYPQRRTARFTQYYYCKEDGTPLPLPYRDEQDLMGQDGHVYKGRIGENIPDEEQTPSRPKTSQGRATSMKIGSAPSSRAPSPNMVPRPRSAAPRSPQSPREAEPVTAQ